jgi:kynureninase
MEPDPKTPERDIAYQMDSVDELASFRNQFVIDDQELIYMDGNSLGRLPTRALERVEKIVRDEWGQQLIRGWAGGWFESPKRVGSKIARLVGAQEDEVVVGDSTSVNLFKAVLSALMMKTDRKKILTDIFNFPSDLYILQGCIHLLGDKHKLELMTSPDSISIPTSDVASALDAETAVITLSHVVFKSGYLYDAAEITRRAHDVGALVVWDLSHAAGSVPVELDAWDADFAIGCTYKYLNGGPGAPAFLYVNKRLQSQAISPIWGWFGEMQPFRFDLEYTPSEGIKRFLAGTPNVLSLLAMEPGVDLLLEAGMERLRSKSIKQTSYLIDLFDRHLAPLGFSLGSPRDADLRGSHISIRHKEGYRINRALIEEMKVIPDFREPDNIRLGVAPIYTTFEDIWKAVWRIQRVVEEGRFLHFPAERLAVT